MANEHNISNEQLSLTDVPECDAEMERIFDFAQSFNGYFEHGSFNACAKIANEQQSKTLTDLRTCLFFEGQRWHHFGDHPDGEDEQYIPGLVASIREMLGA